MRRSRLVERPGLADIVVAGLRRVQAFMPDTTAASDLAKLRPALLEIARLVPSRPWSGGRLDLQRYSARQEAVLEMRGVAGHLELPEGLKSLWPLINALTMLHVGKGTVVGMGQVVVEALPGPS
jgi:hypothetical protein